MSEKKWNFERKVANLSVRLRWASGIEPAFTIALSSKREQTPIIRERIFTSCQNAITSSPPPTLDRTLTSCQTRSHAHLIPDAIASPHPPRCDRIQQLQQQIEAWEALLEKLGGNERESTSEYISSSS
jgi:hypothetical protein